MDVIFSDRKNVFCVQSAVRTCCGVLELPIIYVMKFRSTPFVPWDLFSAGTAASVAGNYDFTPDRRMVIVTLVFIALFVLTRLFKKARVFPGK